MANRMPDDEWSGLVRRQRQVHTENSLRITQVGDLLFEAQRARDSERQLLEASKNLLKHLLRQNNGVIKEEAAAVVLRAKEAIDEAEARDERG